MPNYPISFDTDDSLFRAVNNLQTRLSSAIDASTLTIPVLSTAGFPDVGYVSIPVGTDPTLTEAIYYTSKTPTQFNAAQRGADGTPANSHTSQSVVSHTVISAHHNELKNAIIALEHFVGISGSAVFIKNTDIKAITGAGQVTITSGTNQTRVSVPATTAIVSGTPDLTVTSGSNVVLLRDNNRAIVAGTPDLTVTSGTSTIILRDNNRAVVGGTNISVVSGTNTITISSDISSFTPPAIISGTPDLTITSGTSTTLIRDNNRAIIAGANISVVSGTNTITVSANISSFTPPAIISGTPDLTVTSGTSTTLLRDNNRAIIGGSNISVVSGTNIITVSADISTFTPPAIVSGTPDLTVTSGTNITVLRDNNRAVIAGPNVTITSGTNTITVGVNINTGNAIVSGTPDLTVVSGSNIITLRDNNRALIGDSFIGVISGTNTITIKADAIVAVTPNIVISSGIDTLGIDLNVSPILQNLTASGIVRAATVSGTTVTGLNGQFSGLVSAQSGAFYESLTVSGIPVQLQATSSGGGGLVLSVNGLSGNLQLVGSDGISTSTVGLTNINITGFRNEFISTSGHLQSQLTSNTNTINNTIIPNLPTFGEKSFTTQIVDRAGGVRRFDEPFNTRSLIRKLKVNPTVTGVNSYVIQFFTKDTYNFDDRLEYEATASGLYVDNDLWFHEDADGTSEMHLQLTNTSTLDSSFLVELRFERFK